MGLYRGAIHPIYLKSTKPIILPRKEKIKYVPTARLRRMSNRLIPKLALLKMKGYLLGPDGDWLKAALAELERRNAG